MQTAPQWLYHFFFMLDFYRTAKGGLWIFTVRPRGGCGTVFTEKIQKITRKQTKRTRKKHETKRKTQFRATGDPFGNPEDSWAPAVRSCVLSVCQSWASGDPWRNAGDSWELAVGYCMFFLFFNFRPQGATGGLLGSPGLQLSHIMRSFCFSSSGLKGPLVDSCRLLGYSFRVFCEFFLFVNFRPWGTPGGLLGIPVLQLSNIVCSFCLSVSGLRGPLGDSWAIQTVCSFFVCQFWASGDP